MCIVERPTHRAEDLRPYLLKRYGNQRAVAESPHGEYILIFRLVSHWKAMCKAPNWPKSVLCGGDPRRKINHVSNGTLNPFNL